MSDAHSQSGLVLELAEEFLDRYRNGERPPLQEYIDRHPDLAAEIKEVFPTLAWMENIALADESLEAKAQASEVFKTSEVLRQLGDFRIIREVGHGGMGVVYEAEQVSLGRHVALKVLPHRALADAKHKRRFEREARAAAKLHHTNIVPVFGVGEHEGLPYYAMQFIQGLGLDAVLQELKQLNPVGQAASVPVLRRSDGQAGSLPYERDRSAVHVALSLMTGRLDVAGSDQPACTSGEPTTDGPPPASEPAGSDSPASRPVSSTSVNLPGQSVTGSKTRRATYSHSVAQIGVQVAGALEYAHKQGIVHRDIKPSNLLLDLRGTVWVTDFGLAKADDQQNLTHTGEILGTLRYMPPEALEGKSDGRSDIYSLGLTLYELLAFRPAFDERDRSKLIRQVTGEDPPRLDKLNRTLPRDLVTIVHKAIERDPAHRYQVPAELVADLQRFLDDEPIYARRVSNFEKMWRWGRRNPMVASLAGFVSLLLMTIAIGASLGVVRLNALLGRAHAAEADLSGKVSELESAERATQEKLFESYVEKARALRRTQRMGQRFDSLATITQAAQLARKLDLPPERFRELRNEAVAALALMDLRISRNWELQPGLGGWVEFDENIKRYACGVQGGGVSVRSVEDDRELFRLPGFDASMAHFSPDGRYLAGWTAKGQRLKIWQIDCDPPKVVQERPSLSLLTFTFSPDGRQLAHVKPDRGLEILDLSAGRVRGFPPADGAWEYQRNALAFHPNGKRIAVAVVSGKKSVVQVRDLESGRVTATLAGAKDVFFNPTWHPKGQILAVCDDVEVRLWDTQAENWVAELHATYTGGTEIAFNHAGDLLAATDWSSEVKIWETQSAFLLFKGDTNLAAVRFSRDDRHLAGDTWHTNKLRVWDLPPRVYRRFRELPLVKGNYYRSIAVSPDDRRIAVGQVKGVRMWDLDSGEMVAHIDPLSETTGLAFENDQTLWTFSREGLWRWPVGSPALQETGQVGPPRRFSATQLDRDGISMDRKGHILAVRTRDGPRALRLVPASRWIQLGNNINNGFPIVSPDGQWVALSDISRKSIRILDPNSGKLLRELTTEKPVIAVSVSPNGTWLVAYNAPAFGMNRIWRTDTWEEVRQMPGTVPAFTPDDKFLAIETGDCRIRLLDPATGRELVDLEDPNRELAEAISTSPIVFSHDGTRMFSVSLRSNPAVREWDLWRLRELLDELGLADGLPIYPAVERARTAKSIRFEVLGIEEVGKQQPTQPSQVETALLGLWADPWAFQARLDLAKIEMSRGRVEQAHAHFTLAMLTAQSPADALYFRGECAFRRQRWADAAADSRQALKRNPLPAPTWLLHARSLQKLGKHADAIVDLSALLLLTKNDPFYWELRAASHAALGKNAEAESDRKAARDNLTQVDAKDLNNKAWPMVQGPKGTWDPEHAEALARHATLLSPQMAQYWNTLGVAQYRLGRFADAIPSFQKSLARDGTDAEGFDFFFLAMCHARLGDQVAAQACFAQAVRWMGRQKNLPATWAAELRMIRDEAEAMLKETQASKP